MTFSKAPDYIRDNLMKFEDAHFYRVPSINKACAGCALQTHPDPECFESVKCMDDNGNVHSILIHTDEAAVAKYIIARLK